jgi:hypothetical protein
MANDIKHFGILGMHWGRRMAKDGSVTTLRRGKRVPLMTTVRGKPVQVNGRALSNKTRSFAKQAFDIVKKDPKGFVKEVGKQMVKDVVTVGKFSRDAAITFAAVYGTMKLSEIIASKFD